MKKKRGFLSKFLETGIWLIPIVMIGMACFLKGGIPPDQPITGKDWLGYFGIGCVVALVFWSSNMNNLRRMNEESDGHEEARWPKPPPDMVYYKQPTGFCFGTYGGGYVCKRVDEPGSILVQGSSGSGKSASLIQGFLLNPENKKNCRSLVLDLKHELADKCVAPEDVYSPRNLEGTCILMDPMDRKNGWGFDPFFLLNEDSTPSEVYDTCQVIAQSIVPSCKGDNKIWSDSARQYITGALSYYYTEERLRTLPEIVAKIKAEPIKKVVEKILTTAAPGSGAYTSIINFQDMADETITSVDLEASTRLGPFATSQDIIWCLGNNPRKCSPKDLLEKSIYLCLPEDKLVEWGQLVFLVFNLTLKWMMGLPEKSVDPKRPYLTMILDETVALMAGLEAKMPLLSQCLRIGARSKGCTMLVCVQSITGLYSVMGKDEADDMISNLTYKYILDSTETRASKDIIAWCGKYSRRKVGRNGDGTKRSDNYSYTEEDIVSEQDLLTLPRSGDAILVSTRSGYLRLKKTMVFKDKFFKKLLENIAKKKERGKSV